MAEHLGLTPGAAAGALASLRFAGLVTHVRHAGPAGRFGLSAYVLGPVPGLAVLDGAETVQDTTPSMVPPRMAPPCVVEPHMVKADVAGPAASSRVPPPRARRSAQADAATLPVPAAGDPAAPKSRIGGGSRTEPRRRQLGRPAAAQLSMLDTVTDLELDTTPYRQP